MSEWIDITGTLTFKYNGLLTEPLSPKTNVSENINYVERLCRNHAKRLSGSEGPPIVKAVEGYYGPSVVVLGSLRDIEFSDQKIKNLFLNRIKRFLEGIKDELEMSHRIYSISYSHQTQLINGFIRVMGDDETHLFELFDGKVEHTQLH